jgi:uncharacterized membrane protein
VVSITRHPVLWGFLLWAFSHVIANGDLRSLLLFGTFALFAIFGMITTERRLQRKKPEILAALSGTTSILPFLAIAQRRTHLRFDQQMLIALLATAALTAVLLLGGHAALFGADPLAMAAI